MIDYNYVDYLKFLNQKKYDDFGLINQLNKETGQNKTELNTEFKYIMYYILNTKPCYYYQDHIRKHTLDTLNYWFTKSEKELIINNKMLESVFIAFDTYRQVTEVIQDLGNVGIDKKLKIRMYQIPTYVSVVEGCLTNLYKFITEFLTQVIEKDYSSQNKLFTIIQALNKNKFDEITAPVDVDIRNSINHGSVFIAGEEKIIFKYIKNSMVKFKEHTYYSFDDLINNVYDYCSSILLGIVEFIDEKKNSIVYDNVESEKVNAFRRSELEFSFPESVCRGINDDSINNEQLNINIEIENTGREYLMRTAIEISILAYDKYPNYKKFLINFHNERLSLTFARFMKEEIKEMINGNLQFDECLKQLIKRSDINLSNPSEEEIDLNEIKYYIYPSINKGRFSVENVENASLENRKRFRANLYLGNEEDKDNIIEIIKEAIDWIKTLKNMPIPSLYTKNGVMEADSVYINVYRKDNRRNKALLSNNNNFVCCVDYNIDGVSVLNYNRLPWKNLFREKVDLINIGWAKKNYILGNRKQKK